MAFQKFDTLAFQFFSGVLKGKGVDRPTIAFVWGQGEDSYLWKHWFGSVTKEQMHKLGELTDILHAKPEEMPPLELYKEFDQLTFWRGEVAFYLNGEFVHKMRVPKDAPWDSNMMTTINGIQGRLPYTQG